MVVFLDSLSTLAFFMKTFRRNLCDLRFFMTNCHQTRPTFCQLQHCTGALVLFTQITVQPSGSGLRNWHENGIFVRRFHKLSISNSFFATSVLVDSVYTVFHLDIYFMIKEKAMIKIRVMLCCNIPVSFGMHHVK